MWITRSLLRALSARTKPSGTFAPGVSPVLGSSKLTAGRGDYGVGPRITPDLLKVKDGIRDGTTGSSQNG